MSGTPVTIPVTSAQFRTDFPEFANTSTFPDSTVNYYLNLAQLLLDPARWLTLLGTGIELFTAHHIQMEAFNQQAVNAGGLPGISKGPVASEGDDGVSVSYNTNAILEKDAGHWNLTVYGLRFIKLARMAGMGPIETEASPANPLGIGLNFGPLGFPDTF